MLARISSIVLVGFLLVAFGGVLQTTTAQTEENKAIARRSIEEVWNQGNLDVADEIYASDFGFHDPANPGVRGPDGYKQLVSTYRAGFPDLHFTIEDMIAEGDEVALRWSTTGTHQSEIMGIPGTGRSSPVTGITIQRYVSGKVVDEWAIWDALGMLQQIGVIPPMPEAPLAALNRSGEDFLWDESLDVIGAPGDPEANKALVMRDVEEIWDQGNLDVVNEIFHTEFVSHDPNWPGFIANRESYKQWQVGNQDWDPNQYIAIEDMIAEGDKVAFRGTWHGTDPGTGTEAAVPLMAIFRIADGVIVENWWSKDYLGFMQQLGVVPPLGPTAVQRTTWGQVKSLFK